MKTVMIVRVGFWKNRFEISILATIFFIQNKTDSNHITLAPIFLKPLYDLTSIFRNRL
jgi:hypothetical protein